jgi:glyoxylase-like metal-dependent hydrolase (beta-lactamase superfamily II)
MDGRSIAVRGRLACHCVLVEAGSQLVLIDTGFGLNDVAQPYARLSRFFLALVSPDFNEDATAVRQIQKLGLDPRDVRHIVLTHLDFDHAGGLDDFPWATVHLLAAEREAALKPKTWLDRQRYRPQQWGRWHRWNVYGSAGSARWHGFECVRDLVGLPPEILMVPLLGHTFGHTGVAMREDGGSWLLNAGDAYFYHAEMDLERPRCTPGLRFYQRMMEKDREARLENQRRLRELKRLHGSNVRIMSSHDVREFEALAHRTTGEPPPALAGVH